MLIKILKWTVSIPLVIIMYVYDDALWGPAPIALMNKIFGWPNGYLLLCAAYFVVSFIACLLILKSFRKKKKTQRSKKIDSSITSGRKAYAYKLLAKGKWLGLAIACFTLGAILTSVIIGKLKLFTEINTVRLSFILSLLFVVLFMGFYGGIFALVIEQGWIFTLATCSLIALLVKIFQISNQPKA